MIPDDIKKIYSTDPQWYKKIWTMDIQEMSWVEQTKSQVDFLWDILQLNRKERVLDLACGFGRHSIEIASRGCRVVGVDITTEYIKEARKQAREKGLDAEFICADLRELRYIDDFDVVLNLADGAIGYLENDHENLKIFNLISSALKLGGKHVMDVCNGGHAAKHFPVVSASLRGVPPIMFGMIARNDHMEDHQTADFIREGADLVGFRTELAKKAFEQIG